MTQYIREQWDSERGYPGGAVTAITQTADGYLWIGTNKGLLRFDGLFRIGVDGAGEKPLIRSGGLLRRQGVFAFSPGLGALFAPVLPAIVPGDEPNPPVLDKLLDGPDADCKSEVDACHGESGGHIITGHPGIATAAAHPAAATAKAMAS